MTSLKNAAQRLIEKHSLDPNSILKDEISNLKDGLVREDKTVVIVELTNFEGDTSNIFVAPAKIYMVVSRHSGEIIDCGYESLEEISKSWPEAVNALGLEV